MPKDRSGLPLPKICDLGEGCCGCDACAAVCPVPCITMKPDALGFLHPEVDGDACIRCGSCDRTCPALNRREPDAVEAAFWARATDDELLANSSSGGVFGLLAQSVIAEGGAVYGAAYDEGCKAVRHRRADSLEALSPLMRSKYTQSSIGRELYQEVARDLKAGRPVLFAGTACEISGLGGFLAARHVPTERLLRVDVICHGVTAPKLWADWIRYREERAGAPIRSVNQRSKSSGWTTYSSEYRFAEEKVEASVFSKDWYMKAFLANASLRGSCLACPSKRSCASDLTLGDFWGVGERHPEAFDDRGVSAVICSTAKGRAALDALEGRLLRGSSSLADIAFGNPSLLHAVEPYPRREAFLAEVAAGTPLAELMRRWSFRPSLARRALGKLKRVAKKVLGR